MDIRRGQVWWWDCATHNRKHIQEGMRPVVIVSNDTCNVASPVVTVVPLTTSVKRPYPQQVPIVVNDGISIAIADQLTSIPVSELKKYICTLRDFQMDQIDRAMAIQLGLIRPEDRLHPFPSNTQGD